MKNKLILLSALSGSIFNLQAAEHTNIVVINLDDVGYGDFSYGGALGYNTPNIDKMASEGLRLTHFLAAQPVSGASRAALMTGCYPNRIGMPSGPPPHSPYGISDKETTLAELLKQKGYSTAIFGKWHLGDAPKFLPLQHGFDEYYGLPYSNDMTTIYQTTTKVPIPLIEGNTVIAGNPDITKLTTDYTTRAVSFITRNKKKPFFLYLAHTMAHVPLGVSDKFKGKSKQGTYGDVMMELDWSIGEVMKTLKKLKLEENTLVILTSDNGPWICFGNHAGSAGGLREAKLTTFDGGNRVPCVMYWKGHLPEGLTYNGLATNMDIFPTCAEIAGVKLPELPIDGVSLLPVLKGDLNAEPRKDFVYYFNDNDLQAVTDGMYKLIFPHKYPSYGVPGNDGKARWINNGEIIKPVLYDLRRDPGERTDVYNEYPEVVQNLNRIADDYRSKLGDKATGVEGKENRPHGDYQW